MQKEDGTYHLRSKEDGGMDTSSQNESIVKDYQYEQKIHSDSQFLKETLDGMKKQSRFRNGVETMPSILLRKYGIDKIPIRGLIRSCFFFGCKIGALNIKKFLQIYAG